MSLARFEGELCPKPLCTAHTHSNQPIRFLPYVGYATIAMVRFRMVISVITVLTYTQNDFPQLKYALLGGLGLMALIQRE